MRFKWNAEQDKLLTSLSVAEVAEKLSIPKSKIYGRMHYLASRGKGFSAILSSKGGLSAGKKAALTRAKNKEVSTLPKQVGNYKFVINGVNIEVSGNPKLILTSKESMRIDY